MKLPDNHNDILEIINDIPTDAKEKIYEFAMRKDRDFSKSIPQNFPNDISQKEYNRCNQLNEALKNSIKEYYQQNDIRLQNDQFKKLFNDTMDKYGTNPYKDGQIAAQSAYLLSSYQNPTIIWSACGRGQFGTVYDTFYSNVIAKAIGGKTMANIRDGIEVTDISSTPDEFSAASAFICMNATGKVYIATGSKFPKGPYFKNIELPILLKNPYVKEIYFLDTSKENFQLLNMLDAEINKAKSKRDFVNNSKWKLNIASQNEVNPFC